MLLLDEATSALDTDSAREVDLALRSAAADRTVLMTTHKIAQARDADLIVVMAGGDVAEQGTHAELYARGGLYRQLLQREAGGGDVVESGVVVPNAPASSGAGAGAGG